MKGDREPFITTCALENMNPFVADQVCTTSLRCTSKEMQHSSAVNLEMKQDFIDMEGITKIGGPHILQ